MGSNGPKESCVRWDHGIPEVLQGVAMATNFGTKIAITGFVRKTATIGNCLWRGFECWPIECRYCRYLAPIRDVAMATICGFLYMGCTLASPGEYD